jgi:hypothetical protein
MLSMRVLCFLRSLLINFISAHGGMEAARLWIVAISFLAAFTWSSRLIFCSFVSSLQAFLERLKGGMREFESSKMVSLSEMIAFSRRSTLSEMLLAAFTFESKSVILLMRLFT